jgi:hypothetical protein
MPLNCYTEDFFFQDFSAEEALLRTIRNNLISHESPIDIPQGLKFDFNPDISQVYITLFQRGKKRIRWGSRRKTLKGSIERVIFKLKNHRLFGEFAVSDQTRCRILFEIVTDEYPCDPRKTTIIHLNENRLEPGIHGLKFKHNGQLYYYMPTDAVTCSLMTMKQVYNHLAKRTGIAKQTNRISERVSIMRSLPIEYKIIRSFACISYEENALPLYRGYPVPVRFDGKIALDCLTNSSDWLLNNMKPNGQFLYFYDAVRDSEVDFQHPRMKNPTYYNILRHSGGTITLLRAYEATGSSKYLDGARASIDFFLSVLREHSYMGRYACYPFFNKKSKLGGAGIGLVALLHYYRLSGDESLRKYIDGLVNHILSRVSDSGEMIGYFIHPGFFDGKEIINPDDDVKKELFSFYYPGEALLGLALYLLHIPGIDKATADLIKTKSRNALDFLIHKRPEKYDYMFAPLPADGWLMQAVEEWVKIDGFNEHSYTDFVFNDAQAMIDHMYQEDNAPFFDYVGSFYYHYGEHAYPDGSRCEGLIAAYHLARYSGDEKRADTLLKNILKAAKNLMYTYNTPESCYGHKYPEKSIYSFRFKLTRQWMRVDSVQHTACFYARLHPLLDID